MIALAATLALAYLAGSIPSGVLIARFAGVADPRTIGSGNIGATNVLRSGRKDLAAFTLIADMLKGTAAVLVAQVAAHRFAGVSPVPLPLAAAAAAMVGHCFSLFLRLGGGKGVATFLGCLIAVAWPAAFAFTALWLAVAAISRYSSAAALVASAATPPVLLAMHRPAAAATFAALAALLWLKHSANIARLVAGREGKIGRKASAVAADGGGSLA